jgi:uncharacterized protein YjiS (DUF1127 family)
MPHIVHDEPHAAFAECPALSWRVLVNRVIDSIRTCHARRRQRQDLLNYLASDYRAAADIGVTNSEALGWSRRPFWRV